MLNFLLAAALLALSLLLLKTEDLLGRKAEASLCLVILMAVFALRVILRTPAAEENPELQKAICWFYEAGGLSGLRTTSLPYSLPVQVFLAIFSMAPESGAAFFKALCLFFEIAAAWSCQRCVKSISVRPGPRLVSFVGTLLLPSGIAETALLADGGFFGWPFLLWSCAMALETRIGLSAFLLGVSVVFQPSLVWIVPVFAVFPALRRSPLLSSVSFLGAYSACTVPFLLLGRAGREIYPFYPPVHTAFTNGYGGTAPGLYSLVSGWPDSPAGIVIYASLVLFITLLLCRRRTLRNRRAQLCGIAFVAAAGCAMLPARDIPALYGAELLSLALCCVAPGMLPALLCCVTASFVSVFHSSFPALSAVPAGWLFTALLAAMALYLFYILFPGGSKIAKKKKDREELAECTDSFSPSDEPDSCAPVSCENGNRDR